VRSAGPLGQVVEAVPGERRTDDWSLNVGGLAAPVSGSNLVILTRSLAWTGPNKDAAASALHRYLDGGVFGDAALLRAAASRRAASSVGPWVRVVACTRWRLVVDASPDSTPHGTGISMHPVLGFPVIRSSALRGVAHHLDPDSGKELLGQGDGAMGAVAVSDALPLQPVRLVGDALTPHHREYYQGKGPAAAWDEPVPVQRISVAEGTEFEVFVRPTSVCKEERSVELVERAARLVMRVLSDPLAGVGAGGTNGYGFFDVSAVRADGSPLALPADAHLEGA
jgi:CRISPR/Cas system CMR subunit Cmr6 (Cas7 group RAMP superfamily)